MPNQIITSVENNFTKGLITEFTGMNFPENAATDCDNVEFTIVGDTIRRLGIDLEENFSGVTVDRTGKAVSTYKWDNAGGDGSSQIFIAAIGSSLYFWTASAATVSNPISTRYLGTQSIASFVPTGGSFDTTIACEFTDGNGYAFVFHPSINPLYITYTTAPSISINAINLKIRDFVGVPEAGVDDNIRPSTLTDNHKYNLQNQGWTSGNPWTASDTVTNITLTVGSQIFTVASGISGVSATQYVLMRPYSIATNQPFPGTNWGYGLVTAYAGTLLTINVTAVAGPGTFGPANSCYWVITPVGSGYITDWFGDTGNYPSNADQWWRFKTAAGVFDPATTLNNVFIGLGAAPKGHYLIDAFDQQRDLVSGVTTITDITTLTRPTNGCWFQGRIWYTGVNTSQAATGTAPFTTWTENIYFSQVVQKTDDFGKCYQTNDPTSEDLFDLLPTDGGVITIQGSGPVYRLFPIQNGMLVFAGNGVWFITGSQGIGFAATDYTITKISSVQSISSTSYVNVMGLPYFWNEEGIYQVVPSQSGSLTVEAITVGTILSFYSSIPLSSKKNARAAYHPIDYVIQWIYKSTEASDTADKYTYDKILNFNTYNKSFYPYTVDKTSGSICAINYIAGVGGSSSPEPTFKYLSSYGGNISFADLRDTDYVDWASTGVPVDYTSYFITGYKLHGQAQRKVQTPYVYVYSRNNQEEQRYKIQSRWDYSVSGNSGRWSSEQVAYIDNVYASTVMKRHRLRGHGLVVQFKFTSYTGQPFDIVGWSVFETQNTGV